MKPSEDPSDRLVDSLLREQTRGKADEALLQAIEEKLDGVPLVQRPSGSRRSRSWLPLSAAAAVVLGGVGTYMWDRQSRSETRVSEAQMAAEDTLPSLRGKIVDDEEAKDPGRANASVEATPPRALASGEKPSEGMDAFAEAAPAAPRATTSGNIPDSSVQFDGIEAKKGSPSLEAPMEERGLAGGRGAGGGRGVGSGSGRGEAAPAAESKQSEAPAKAMSLAARNDSLDSFGSAAGGFVRPGEDAATERRVKGRGLVREADDGFSRENYGRLVDQPWKSPWQEALSTFSIDVDNASYTNLRRMIMEGRTIPADAVRIEECLNYFDYRYEGPKGDGPFAVHGDLATCPWKPGHLLARVAIKGKEIPNNARPASNLVFLVDVSGSMQSPDKLPLLKRSMRVLIDQLDERDRVGMVVYAGTEGVVLEPTLLDERGKSRAIQALEKLEAGGSTNGGAGIKRAYEMARKHLVEGGTNRVILATDGDFNVGTTGQGDLVNLVKSGSGNRIYLSVLGFGTGNLNDAMLEAITKDGNGNYFYVDNDGEARRVFLQKLTGTLVTIAKDVKIQVEFNPGKVKAYRLIGYANRILRHEDFNNDAVDAGDIGAGHTVTAFYEIVPDGVAMPDTGGVDALRYQRPAGKEVVASEDWFTLKLRHKHPEGDTSSLIETPVKGEATAWENAGNDFRFASAVALFGMKLRQMPDVADVPWAKVESIAKPALAEDPQEQRSEFIGMVRKIGGYDAGR
jgi:Ca-activated chloride channel family protein